MLPNDFEDEEPVQFNLLKATGDLLMLPKEILLDSEIRKEVLPSTHSWVSVLGVLFPRSPSGSRKCGFSKFVLINRVWFVCQVCPGLNLPLIRRVLANFVPDVFSPDPLSPALLDALATEASYFECPIIYLNVICDHCQYFSTENAQERIIVLIFNGGINTISHTNFMESLFRKLRS